MDLPDRLISPLPFIARCMSVLFCLGLSMPLHAEDAATIPLSTRIAMLTEQLDSDRIQVQPDRNARSLPALRLQIQQCDAYPYHDPGISPSGASQLVEDLRAGLETGLRCLAGQGPMGRLHPYHEYQAHRLLTLFENDQPKTLHCIADQMFATAVATTPGGTEFTDPLARQLSLVEHPGIVFDTYRLGGILSRKHDDETYRAFFHLDESEIQEHRNGQPLRPANLHRYKKRPALLFHETVHWLGHQHSAIYPDLTHLYETCCFGGSDYISDEARNKRYQQTACTILRDDEIWSQSYKPYKQMRLWHFKGYDRLKPQMRSDYDS